MKIRYTLKDKKLQKKLNLQSSITEKKITFYSTNNKIYYTI